MQFLINYIVESSVALGILTLFYLLAIQKTTRLGLKRVYMLVALVFDA